ncbi:hypothetical protein PIB30_092302 [Stylosanthes scabra]|uniref:Uncharacterized protein n=1 Tax=Stylosanthes scabra TaxID=79078 RepID=A0ABU6QUZ3_9FABA|nr:hypothetical protein [Stylosanthes scabra]
MCVFASTVSIREPLLYPIVIFFLHNFFPKLKILKCPNALGIFHVLQMEASTEMVVHPQQGSKRIIFHAHASVGRVWCCYNLWKTMYCKYFVWVDEIDGGWEGLSRALIGRTTEKQSCRTEAEEDIDAAQFGATCED